MNKKLVSSQYLSKQKRLKNTVTVFKLRLVAIQF